MGVPILRCTTLILGLFCVASYGYTPIVLWHGMGDSCCFSFSLGAFKNRLTQQLPGVYVLSLRIGSSMVNDVENGYFMHPNKQVEEACETIKNDPKLSDGFNAVGFSQGSQFLRALVQRCSAAKVKNLISLGGQHQGVYGLPNCGSLSHPTCDYFRRLLNHAAYNSFVQKRLVQATYWHDPLNEDLYKKSSTFLSDINNELTVNESYKENILKLDNFVMVLFENDTMVQPVESEFFGFYKPGQSVELVNLTNSQLYNEDRLGLRELDNKGGLHFLALPGNHLEFEWPWFIKMIMEPYLKN
ncbi:unnamed protein product [Brassicogethes aeneus]|uniref:Palmitoyl-protein thioesterase 1 n=1 Tax=Brassicogethes aeneus TaxID=1431903 RepID=A0A9P0AP74_BRAAE|nr:unnamed protein product [Brassicogethes aeneus]